MATPREKRYAREQSLSCRSRLAPTHFSARSRLRWTRVENQMEPGSQLVKQANARYSPLPTIHISHGGIAPHKLRKAVALIDRNLFAEAEKRVALRRVAQEIGLSYFHFSRA